MPLDAVMVLVDNSERSRNGDYQPTRFEAQVDAVNIIFQTITASNPESEVGLMSMAGKGPQVLTTMTTQPLRILDGLHRTKQCIGGSSHLWNALKVAFLALKHRQNRSQRQRIIAFVCSPPLPDEEGKFEELALKLKKSNVVVDIVLFGDLEQDTTRLLLERFIGLVKGDKPEAANLIVIMPSSNLLSDQLIATPLLLGPGATAVAAAAGAASDFNEFGFDSNLEPELALALRMSVEEEKARQDRVAREEEEVALKASLETVSEEAQPLLKPDGEPSGSGKDHEDKKAEPEEDKMDTS